VKYYVIFWTGTIWERSIHAGGIYNSLNEAYTAMNKAAIDIGGWHNCNNFAVVDDLNVKPSPPERY